VVPLSLQGLKLIDLGGPLLKGTFLSRPNRFSAILQAAEGQIACHLHDPGRLTELLLPGAAVIFREAPSLDRKTRFDLVAVKKGGKWVVVDSRIPNQVFRSMLEKGILDYRIVKEEYAFGNSRIDFLLEKEGEKILVEVKGCSLCTGGRALFPDAPTSRGRRHILELEKWNSIGLRSMLFFVVLCPDAFSVSPNEETDPAFSAALRSAMRKGLKAEAAKAVFDEASSSIWFMGFLPVTL
jgi:sugar fermentation stimulation protein A